MEYNKHVKHAQLNLIGAGYGVGTSGADGKFGNGTLQGVNAAIYDAVNGQEPAEDDTEYPFNGELVQGDENEDVKNLQSLLKKWHMAYYLGAGQADGVFGAGTKQAVLEYQKGMSQKPDGKVDEELWDLLNGEPVDISIWTTLNADGRLPFACNCQGRYCDSDANAVPGKTSVGLMILLVRIGMEMNRLYSRDDIVIHLTDDMNLNDIDDRNGGNRCTKWNEMHGGAQNSQHTKWRAADIYFDCLLDGNSPDIEDLYDVCDRLNPFGGVGGYRGNVHVDGRGSRARW